MTEAAALQQLRLEMNQALGQMASGIQNVERQMSDSQQAMADHVKSAEKQWGDMLMQAHSYTDSTLTTKAESIVQSLRQEIEARGNLAGKGAAANRPQPAPADPASPALEPCDVRVNCGSQL